MIFVADFAASLNRFGINMVLLSLSRQLHA